MTTNAYMSNVALFPKTLVPHPTVIADTINEGIINPSASTFTMTKHWIGSESLHGVTITNGCGSAMLLSKLIPGDEQKSADLIEIEGLDPKALDWLKITESTSPTLWHAARAMRATIHNIDTLPPHIQMVTKTIPIEMDIRGGGHRSIFLEALGDTVVRFRGERNVVKNMFLVSSRYYLYQLLSVWRKAFTIYDIDDYTLIAVGMWEDARRGKSSHRNIAYGVAALLGKEYTGESVKRFYRTRGYLELDGTSITSDIIDGGPPYHSGDVSRGLIPGAVQAHKVFQEKLGVTIDFVGTEENTRSYGPR